MVATTEVSFILAKLGHFLLLLLFVVPAIASTVAVRRGCWMLMKLIVGQLLSDRKCGN